MKHGTYIVIGAIATAWVAVGCTGLPTKGELEAKRGLQQVTEAYRPSGAQLPKLSSGSSMGNYVQFGIMNQPEVAAAYFDWAASVERITQVRSRPDPRLTFSADIADMLMGLMPGLMVDFPGPGKLRAGAEVATAESQAKYFQFEKAMLQTAFNVKSAYYELLLLDTKLDVNKQTLALLSELEQLARTQNEVGKVTLQDVLRAQIEQDRLSTEIANLEDSKKPLIAQFKSALGLGAEDPEPPLPSIFETTSLDLSSEGLLTMALTRNPRIKGMEAEVRMAEASIGLARKTRVPDFSAGIEVNAYTSPAMVTPLVGMTLPIWRDKITAQIAEAQANKRAAEARLSREQIMVAVEIAERTYTYREASRNLSLLRDKLLTKAEQSLDVAKTGYVSGRSSFLDLVDAERMLLEFRLMEVDARVQRELAMAELSLVLAAVPPASAPLLRDSRSPHVREE